MIVLKIVRYLLIDIVEKMKLFLPPQVLVQLLTEI